METDNTLPRFDQYHADVQSIIDHPNTLIDNASIFSNHPSHSSTNASSMITFNRDPAVLESLTNEIRWLLIQYGPYQPRNSRDIFLANTTTTNNKKGPNYFRDKWFDDVRFSNWLEYSPSNCRAYCFFCRLFGVSLQNRAFSHDGITNWRKCLGSRGKKKTRSVRTLIEGSGDAVTSQRRGLLESHPMSQCHKHAYQKYIAFIDRMRLDKQMHIEPSTDAHTTLRHDINEQNNP